MNSDRFHELVKTYGKDPRGIDQIGLPFESLTRVAAWLTATYGDIKVCVDDFGTEEARLLLAKRCGQQEIAIAAAVACQIPTDEPTE